MKVLLKRRERKSAVNVSSKFCIFKRGYLARYVTVVQCLTVDGQAPGVLDPTDPLVCYVGRGFVQMRAGMKIGDGSLSASKVLDSTTTCIDIREDGGCTLQTPTGLYPFHY